MASLSFGQASRVPPSKQRVGVMVLMLLVCGAMLPVLRWLAAEAPPQAHAVVEVRGNVPEPGFYSLVPPVTVSAAISAAGGQHGDSRQVPVGSVVMVSEDGISVQPMDKRLVIGLPVSVNSASRAALETVPGIGAVRAEAIVLSRTDDGPFSSLDDLTRVKGVGPATLARIRPFLSVD